MGLWKSAGFGRWILLVPGSIQEYVLPNSHPQLQQAWQNKWRNKGCKRPENEWSTKAEKDTQDYRKAYSRIEKACDVCKCTVRKCRSAKHVLTKKLEKKAWETGRIISVTCLNKICPRIYILKIWAVLCSRRNTSCFTFTAGTCTMRMKIARTARRLTSDLFWVKVGTAMSPEVPFSHFSSQVPSIFWLNQAAAERFLLVTQGPPKWSKKPWLGRSLLCQRCGISGPGISCFFWGEGCKGLVFPFASLWKEAKFSAIFGNSSEVTPILLTDFFFSNQLGETLILTSHRPSK